MAITKRISTQVKKRKQMSKKLDNHIVEVNKKVTAVEWLIEEIQKLGIQITFGNKLLLMSKIEQAKEIEKQQSKFLNSPIHNKKVIIEMMDKLHPKEMIDVVDFIKLKLETYNK